MNNQKFDELGYPQQLLSILSVWKILSVFAILLLKFTILKEWQNAGFFFAMSGASLSHFIAGKSFTQVFPGLIFIACYWIILVFETNRQKINSD